MTPRKPYWCVAELKDGKLHPVSRAYEYPEDAEQRKNELLETEKQRGKNLQVCRAWYPVDPRKPLHRRRR